MSLITIFANIKRHSRQSAIVAKYTFIEVLKSKVLVNIFLLGIAMAVVCFIASEFTFGVPQRVALDFGLGTLTLAAVAIALFMGVGLILKEIEERTVYMVLARPIGRASFLVGRLAGMSGVLLLNILILGGLTLALYSVLGGKLTPILFWALLFAFFEALLILLVVIFFSMITNSTLSVIFTLATYIVGHAISDTLRLGFVTRSPFLAKLISIYAVFFPNFSKLNIKDFILYQQHLETNYLLLTCTYVAVYAFALVLASSIIFERKNLD